MCLAPAGLLEEQGIRPLEPEVGEHQGVPVLFPVTGSDLPYDPFAGAFYLLTRYEEYLGMDQDPHGRPITTELHGGRHGYLQRPVVDEWALQLWAAWKALDATLPDPQRSYRQVCTIDLDNGFKYLGRPLWRTLGSMVRDLLKGRGGEWAERMAVLTGKRPDPFDIHAELQGPLGRAAQRILYFVLAAPRSKWDHAVPPSHPLYAERLRGLLAWAEVGLHPGYFSSEHPGDTLREKRTLEAVLGRPVRSSRQHFLRMRLPDTMRELAGVGMEEEHSMGLHDLPGFRAGTCTPYSWYDLPLEQPTPLRIHPFTVMDNTLKVKMGLQPKEALEQVAPLIERIRAVEGTFTGLWHESFLARTTRKDGWREAILDIIEAARP
jgi:hypothetical protein